MHEIARWIIWITAVLVLYSIQVVLTNWIPRDLHRTVSAAGSMLSLIAALVYINLLSREPRSANPSRRRVALWAAIFGFVTFIAFATDFDCTIRSMGKRVDVQCP